MREEARKEKQSKKAEAIVQYMLDNVKSVSHIPFEWFRVFLSFNFNFVSTSVVIDIRDQRQIC